MALTPVDIANKEFPVRMRGYDRDAVDDFLDQVVQEFEALIRENASLREQIEQPEPAAGAVPQPGADDQPHAGARRGVGGGDPGERPRARRNCC